MTLSSGLKPMYAMMSRELHSMLRWVTITPLGSPVEPEVNIKDARSREPFICGNGNPGSPIKSSSPLSGRSATPISSAHERTCFRKRFETNTSLTPASETIFAKVSAASSVGKGTAAMPARIIPR